MSTSAESSPNTARLFYRPELDVVRLIAFLLVFLHHVLPRGGHLDLIAVPAGFGLSLFFTLSAYLIFEILLREKELSSEVHVGGFYVRRVLRIWPLYFLGLVLACIVASVPGQDHVAYRWAVWAALFARNWFVVFKGLFVSPMFPLWSISIEEQFYLFVPWVVRFFNRRAQAIFALTAIAGAFLALGVISTGQSPDSSVWFNSFVQFLNFGAGILLCLALRGRAPSLGILERGLLLLGCAACYFFAVFGFGIRFAGTQPVDALRLIAGYALASAGCVLCLLAFLGVRNAWLSPVLVYLGKISYGLYVFHTLALWLVEQGTRVWHLHGGRLPLPVHLLVSLIVTIVFAMASYRFLEAPFLRYKRRYEVVRARPV